MYGLATNGGGDGDGQTQWSTFAASAGWTYTNEKRWGTEYQYDSKTFQSVIKWYFGLAKKGYMVPFTDYNSQSNQANTQVSVGQGGNGVRRRLDDLVVRRLQEPGHRPPPSLRPARRASAPR